MRSIKYELQGADKQTVIDAVMHDNKKLYGALNFNDYLADPDEPNLLDFWLKALSLGFVFSNQNSIEREFKKYLGQETPEQKLYASLKEELRNTIDRTRFVQFFFTRQRGLLNKTTEQRERMVLQLGDEQTLKPFAQKWATELSAEKDADLLAFKSEIFHVQKPTLPERALDLAFAIDPSFAEKTIKNRTSFLDELIASYKETCGEDQAKRFLGIGDNGNYTGAVFGNLFEVVQGNTEEVTEFLSTVYQLDNKDELKRRLTILRDLARKIGRPKLVNRWSDYRSDFNGTIESWYSNRESKQKETMEQLGAKRELLQKINDVLDNSSDIKQGILKETRELIDAAGEKIDRAFTDELESYLATLNTELNEASQRDEAVKQALGTLKRTVKDEEGNVEERKMDWQKQLSSHVQSSPLFFGENKRALWEQLKNLKSLIAEEVVNLERFLNGRYRDYEITNKQVDMLAQLANRLKLDGNKEVVAVLRHVEAELGVTFADRTERASFNVTGYERAKRKELAIATRIKVSRLVELANLNDLYKQAKTTPQTDNLLRDVNQLSKIVLSALVHDSDKKTERLVTKSHSILSGYANLISKRAFISRYPVQAVNGGQNLLGFDETTKRYFYAFSDEKFPGIEKKNIVVAKQGNNFSADDKTKWQKEAKEVPALAVQSSRHQIQFLDWFFKEKFGGYKKRKTTLSAGGSFTIAEKNIRVDWSGQEPKIVHGNVDRLFVSQPFTINPPEQRAFDARNVKNRYIGIDIGEYGLAWSLIRADGQHVTREDSGFIADPQQQTLKKDVKNLRERQVRATFTSPDTKIARLRESLIGSYRNQLEDLAMRKNARLSFEYEVSAFETGGKRIVVIYDSIKQGSVLRKGNDAANKQAWGKLKKADFAWRAFETTAAGTSRFCTKCKRDNTDFLAKGTDGKTVEKLYEKVRPNLGDGARRAYAENELKTRRVGFTLTDDWIKTYGTIALFFCQNPDCEHVAHADLQAAFNIAVRGYLKDSVPADLRDAKGNVKPGVLSREYLTNAAQGLTFDPIVGL